MILRAVGYIYPFYGSLDSDGCSGYINVTPLQPAYFANTHTRIERDVNTESVECEVFIKIINQLLVMVGRHHLKVL